MLFTLSKNNNHYGNNNRSIAHCKDLSVVLLLYLLVSRYHKSYNDMHQPIEEGFAAERILLRKVGGGYIFVHRLLLDYFVSLDAPTAV